MPRGRSAYFGDTKGFGPAIPHWRIYFARQLVPRLILSDLSLKMVNQLLPKKQSRSRFPSRLVGLLCAYPPGVPATTRGSAGMRSPIDGRPQGRYSSGIICGVCSTRESPYFVSVRRLCNSQILLFYLLVCIVKSWSSALCVTMISLLTVLQVGHKNSLGLVAGLIHRALSKDFTQSHLGCIDFILSN